MAVLQWNDTTAKPNIASTTQFYWMLMGKTDPDIKPVASYHYCRESTMQFLLDAVTRQIHCGTSVYLNNMSSLIEVHDLEIGIALGYVDKVPEVFTKVSKLALIYLNVIEREMGWELSTMDSCVDELAGSKIRYSLAVSAFKVPKAWKMSTHSLSLYMLIIRFILSEVFRDINGTDIEIAIPTSISHITELMEDMCRCKRSTDNSAVMGIAPLLLNYFRMYNDLYKDITWSDMFNKKIMEYGAHMDGITKLLTSPQSCVNKTIGNRYLKCLSQLPLG